MKTRGIKMKDVHMSCGSMQPFVGIYSLFQHN